MVIQRTEIVVLAEALMQQVAGPAGPENVLFKCPFHEGGTHRGMTFSMNIYSGACHCFSHRCGASFGSLKFLAKKLGVTDDLELIEQIAKIKPAVAHTGLEQMEEIPLAILHLMEDPYDKIPQFTQEALDAFEVRYDSEIDALVYPLRDQDGRLVRLHCRMLDPGSFQRYRFFSEEDYKRYGLEITGSLGKGHNFLNGHRVIPAVLNDKLDQIVMVEGPKQAMRVYEAGYRQVLATLGAFGGPQLMFLQLLDCRFFTFFDNDEGGEKAHETFYRKMLGCNPVTRIDYGETEKRQPDDLTVDQVRQLFAKQGAEKWLDNS